MKRFIYFTCFFVPRKILSTRCIDIFHFPACYSFYALYIFLFFFLNLVFLFLLTFISFCFHFFFLLHFCFVTISSFLVYVFPDFSITSDFFEQFLFFFFISTIFFFCTLKILFHTFSFLNPFVCFSFKLLRLTHLSYFASYILGFSLTSFFFLLFPISTFVSSHFCS